MRNVIAILAAGLFCTGAAAQGIVPAGAVADGGAPVAQTTLSVGITVLQQDITAGPYARYAQKYLGVSAPLADKELYEIVSADIATDSGGVVRAQVAAESGVVSHIFPRKGFPKLLIDRMSDSQLSLEENARAAAGQIFKIRRSRMDLITAEAGENVFGAGLEAALAKLDRLEEEYLSLFLGRQIDTYLTKQYRITPTADKLNYIVCRFSEIDGLLAEDDLSGQPVVLEMKPRGTVQSPGAVQKPAKTDRPYRIADDVLCRVIFNNAEIAAEVIPVYQFGATVYFR